MTLQLRSLSLGASHHLQAWCALVAPHQAPGLELFALSGSNNCRAWAIASLELLRGTKPRTAAY